jgi:type IV pilus assembly protein PilP
MRHLTKGGLALVAVVAATSLVRAQAKPVQPAAPATAPAAAAETPAPPGLPPADAFTYDPAGRRDPFQPLIGAGTAQAGARKKGEGGPADMNVSEISVRGVMQSQGKLIAMVMGPDNKTYIVHQGDKLADGSIRLITPEGLVIDQEVNDPLSVVKQREVRKLLRGLEDAK